MADTTKRKAVAYKFHASFSKDAAIKLICPLANGKETELSKGDLVKLKESIKEEELKAQEWLMTPKIYIPQFKVKKKALDYISLLRNEANFGDIFNESITVHKLNSSNRLNPSYYVAKMSVFVEGKFLKTKTSANISGVAKNKTLINAKAQALLDLADHLNLQVCESINKKCFASKNSKDDTIGSKSVQQKVKKRDSEKRLNDEKLALLEAKVRASQAEALELSSVVSDSAKIDAIYDDITYASRFLNSVEQYNFNISKITGKSVNVQKLNERKKLVSDHVVFQKRVEIDGKWLNSFKNVTFWGIGKGSSLTIAKRLSTIDLANRISAFLNESSKKIVSDNHKSTNDRKSLIISGKEDLLHRYVNFSFSDELRNSLSASFDNFNKSQCFSIDCEELPNLSDSLSQVNSNELKTLPESCSKESDYNSALKSKEYEIIDKTSAPDRASSKALPIHSLYHKFIKSVSSNRITIISAATGSGKTTQLPQYILDHYLEKRRHLGPECGPAPRVICTQPRRIAAITVCRRVKSERVSGAGSVGYAVRFENSHPQTLQEEGSLLFCTNGILLRMLHSKPTIPQYSHVILDEVHERDVNTDVALLIMKRLLVMRPDLKLILMSATLQSQRFKDYFDGFSVGTLLDIEGTNYPVKEHYLEKIVDSLPVNVLNSPQLTSKFDSRFIQESRDFIDAELSQDLEGVGELIIRQTAAKLKNIPFALMALKIKEICEDSQDNGSILVFLPGWAEITQFKEILDVQLENYSTAIHCLHSSVHATSIAFQIPPRGTRKIILATNIAESSITIPDIVHVLDSGRQKVMFFNQAHRMNVLQQCWNSKANVRQRLGRAGRCQAGNYFGFYSERRMKDMPDCVSPELLRLGLDETCLNMEAMGFGSSALLETLDPPEKSSISSSIKRLKDLGALDAETLQITNLGKLLASFPLSPSKSKMLISSILFKCYTPILNAVSCPAENLFRMVKSAQEKLCLQQFHDQFSSDNCSDHAAVKNQFNEVNSKKFGASRGERNDEDFGSGSDRPHSDHWIHHLMIQFSKANPHYFSIHYPRFAPLISLRVIEETIKTSQLISKDLDKKWSAPLNINENSENVNLIRFILFSTHSCNIAIYKGRRNAFRLIEIPEANSTASSQNYRIKTLHTNHNEIRPRFYYYEDVVDLGEKLIPKTSAIDPVWTALLSKDITIVDKEMIVDGWLKIKSTDSRDLLLLQEFCIHLREFVNFMILKQLQNVPLTKEEKENARLFINLLAQFTKESSFFRTYFKDSK